ncbi:hypothetical protein [Sphingomonas glacialis]|nr:hypothetical protein [Sphingomonas glacialis]
MPTEADFKAAAAEVRATHWYARGPAKLGVRATLDQLHAKLTTSTELYETGGLDDQRYAVVDALNAIQEFLIGQGFNPNVLKPAHRPIEALVEQYNNGLDPMFAERRNEQGGRQRTSPDEQHRTGALAAMAQFWIEIHPRGDQQLAEAARRLRGRFFGSDIDADDLLTARKKASKHRRAKQFDHPIVYTAMSVRRMIDGYAADYGPAKAVTLAIWHLNYLAPATETGNWQTIKGEPVK